MKLNIKYHPQQEDYSCGPACLRMIFNHLGKEYSEEKMIALCKTMPKTGTSHEKIIEVLKNEEIAFFTKTNSSIKQLISLIDKSFPVIVNYYDDESNEGHYSIVSGYDKKEKKIIMADPYKGNDYEVEWSKFRKLWHNGNNTSKKWILVIGTTEDGLK